LWSATTSDAQAGVDSSVGLRHADHADRGLTWRYRRRVGRLRLGWLPDVPTAEQRLELCAGDEITSYAFGDRRIDLRQVQDPNREWARGRGSWRQRTLNGRRLAWRIEEGRVIVFQRIGGTAVWVTGTGFEASEVLRSAASLPADQMPAS